ncbi:hypothetical protein BMF94_0594 [Rhodotorula taiwanensis]|uniref:Uncharacterized protein n=1 Tax=Rhodotorula taiwanensis TaxID=741276 RepID=A0A2S5BHZ2_9BASI|nr:hypothetical protein BMF94_0594 [Rhodotorula taiwanensis]
MATAFVPIMPVLAPFDSATRPSNHYRTPESVSSSVRPFTVSPTRRTFSILDFEPKIKVVVQPQHAHAHVQSQAAVLEDEKRKSNQPPPPPYRDSGRSNVQPDRDLAAQDGLPAFRPLPLKLRFDPGQPREIADLLRKARSSTSGRKGVWFFRGLSLQDTFAPLELLLLGAVSLYTAATLFTSLQVGLAAPPFSSAYIARLQELSAHAHHLPKLRQLGQKDSRGETIEWLLGAAALVALAFLRSARHGLYRGIPYLFAVGTAFFACAGLISGLYRLLTRRQRALRAPTPRAMRRNATLRRVVYLVDTAAAVHFALGRLSDAMCRPLSFWTVWAAYALVPPVVLVVFETVSAWRRQVNPEIRTVRYRMHRPSTETLAGGRPKLVAEAEDDVPPPRANAVMKEIAIGSTAQQRWL